MLSRIMQSLTFIEHLLKDRFVEQSFTVENIMGYVRAAGEFILMVHIFVCLFLYLGQFDNEWFANDGIEYDSVTVMYIDANYFVTTTMTSIGYGDFSAQGKGNYSTIGVMVTQFFGILGFSIVKEQVFSSKNLMSITELVAKA